MMSVEATRFGGSFGEGRTDSPSGSVNRSEGVLEGVNADSLAARHGTPLQVYSANAIRNRIRSLHAALQGLDALVCFAAKANSCHAILNLMAENGVGADIVSVGELERCLRAGISGSRMVFSGVGKTEAEMSRALECGVGRFNVESVDELDGLQRVAAQRGLIACAAVRVNPDVDALTHAKISTGKAENKFGVGMSEARTWFEQARQRPNVRLDGLHVHIGSQILDLGPFRQALDRVAEFHRELVAAGHAITSIDVGGGLGVCYREGHDHPPDVAAYVEVVRHALREFRGRIVLEPGRWLVAEAGVLLTRVIRVKQGEQRRFLIIDAAMNDLLRPSLYEAWHDIVAVRQASGPMIAYDIVGPVCETGDTFALARELPECQAGDLLAIKTTGAYGTSMASSYNSRPLLAEVMIDDGRSALIRQRQSLDAMIADEVTSPQWISA